MRSAITRSTGLPGIRIHSSRAFVWGTKHQWVDNVESSIQNFLYQSMLLEVLKCTRSFLPQTRTPIYTYDNTKMFCIWCYIYCLYLQHKLIKQWILLPPSSSNKASMFSWLTRRKLKIIIILTHHHRISWQLALWVICLLSFNNFPLSKLLNPPLLLSS